MVVVVAATGLVVDGSVEGEEVVVVASTAIFSLPPHETKEKNPVNTMRKIFVNLKFLAMLTIPPLLRLSLQWMGVFLQCPTLLDSLAIGVRLTWAHLQFLSLNP